MQNRLNNIDTKQKVLNIYYSQGFICHLDCVFLLKLLEEIV